MREQNDQLGSMHSNQHMMSVSASRSRLDSHIKSSLAHLQGKQDKRYLFLKVHNAFADHRDPNCLRLIELLREEFESKAEIRYFKETKELLADSYDDNQLHYIIVPENALAWAETFAKQEREESSNRKKIFVYGLLQKSVATEKQKARSRKKIEGPDYVQYFTKDDPDYPDEIVRQIEMHLQERLRQEGKHTRAWAVTNKFAGKSVKRRTLHFFYEPRMEKELTGMYQAYRRKAKSSWIQIYKYESFEDVLRKIRERTQAFTREQETARQVTSRILKSTSEIEAPSMRSGFDGGGAGLNSSILSSSIRAISKLDQHDVNIIIVQAQHPEIQKFRALVRAQKHGNWFLWELASESADFFEQLQHFLNEEVKGNEQREAEEYQRIVRSRSLIILALSSDLNTIEMFNAQQNVLHNMQLLLYSDAEEFSILLREGVQSSEDFVVAIVPGGFKSFATEYAKVIAEFDAKYRNVDCVQNYKFISNANGRHVSNIVSSNLLGTQSNLTYCEDNNYLDGLMRDRDKHFHPLEGLRGHNVYLLVSESIQHLLDDLREHVASSPRLHISAYIDREFLTKQIQTIILKDSVLIITDDTTLREAQTVARKFDQVSILNITDRDKAKEEVKVIASAKKDKIYELIRSIPETNEVLDSEIYEEQTGDESYKRNNRVLPKRLTFRPGDTISIRLPANLADEESHKMEVRLQRHFNKEIKIEYYKEPRDVRIANKLEEPLAFIVWTDSADSPSLREKRRAELEYFKELAKNEAEELRLQFIVYSRQPKQYQSLTVLPALERFKFVSSRWERIEEYIIGSYRNFLSPESGEDTIFSDEMIRVFFDDKDKTSRQLVNAVSKRRDGDILNAANHVQFHLIDDLRATLEEQSPSHKYYIVLNEQTSDHSRPSIIKVLSDYPQVYARILLVYRDSAKKIQAQDTKVRRVFASEGETGEWLCKIKVNLAGVDFVIPHVAIDRSCLEYYYFLEKYSRLTGRFTFAFYSAREDVRQELLQRKARPNDQVWIIVKDARSIGEYTRLLERSQNFKNVRFVVESGDSLPMAARTQVVFRDQSRREVEKFLLNIYRRDKSIFFPSSVRPASRIVLIIMHAANGRSIPINKQEMGSWEDILKAEVVFAKDVGKLTEAVKQRPNDALYVVYPSSSEKEVANLCGSYRNLRRIALAPEYDPRKLGTNFVDTNNKIYVGTYPAEVTDYLRKLRYNLRRSEEALEKRITHELIEICLQKEYKLSEQELNYLTTKNDSVIVAANGFEPAQLPALLTRADKFSYLQIFVGDEETTGKAVADFNKRRGKAVQFVDAKASPLVYMGQGQGGERLLETNEREELITFLYNIPENRYLKAINNRGKFLLYCNPEESSIYPYVADLKQICERNPKIEVRHYANTGMLGSVLKEPGVILINGMSEKEYLEKVKPVSGVSYMVANEEYSSDRNYASYGNKMFITRHAKEFQNFMNQVATNYDTTLAPVTLMLDTPASLANIASFASRPLPNAFPKLLMHPAFSPKPPEQAEELAPVELRPGVIDSAPPSLLGIDFPLADVPSLPLGFEVLRRISDASVRGENQILRANLDAPPAQGWFNIRSEPDSFAELPRSIAIPKPAPPMRLKLAVLHHTSREFSAIGEMLKRNLQPEQFSVTVIEFKSEHELEEYSKNNGQRLNGYDKIVVFLSHPYRKYDSTLRLMKSKLTGRMEYFFFDDSFHLNAHPTLKAHLKPYRIRPYPLPYTAPALPALLSNAPRIAILVPHALLPRYEGLKAAHVNVVGYSGDGEIRGQLHREGTFLIIVCDRNQYHQLKMYAKVSPRCRLVVDTPQDLLDDELYLYRISNYTLYYGSAAPDYLRSTLPGRPGTGNEDLRFLFFGSAEEQLAFMEDFDDYQRVHFADWRELYQLLLFELRGRSNWLIKPSPGRPELIPLHPRVYMQSKDYMRDFKNNFTERGYLNDEKEVRKSTLAIHEFADLPQVYYADEKELTRLLQKQESPSVVLWDAANNRVGSMRGKFVRHKWVGLSDYSDRWIDPQGELPEVTDDRLVRKQDMFTNMFNNRVFEEFNDMQYYYLSNKAHVDHTRNILFRTKEQLLDTFNQNLHQLMVVFVEDKDFERIPQDLRNSNIEPLGRAKLILLNTAFLDKSDKLYIKFNEIDPVIKHINAVESAGRIDFIVYNEAEGERTRQTFIQKRKLKKLENKPYTNSFDLEDIARDIKGRYKKVYVICLPDERAEIETLFTSYAIQNKGIPNEGVEFITIDRLSTIRPNLSHLSNIREAQNKPEGYPSDSHNLIPPSSENTLRPDSRTRKEPLALGYTDSANYGVKEGESERRGRNNIAEEYLEKQRNRNDYIEEEDFQLPNTQSNIKPPNKMDGILASNDYQLHIDEKLKPLFPPSKFRKARYFKDPRTLPDAEGRPQLIISAQANPELASLAEEADNFVVVVGPGGRGMRSDGNTLVVGEEEVPGLVRKLESNEEDELAMRNLDDFEKVRVVYDKDMDLESKKRLLAASEKNKKICPTIFRGVGKLKEYMQEPDSLLLLMMSYVPENLQATVAQQNRVIVKKRRIKMILPRKGDSEVDGLQTILEEEEADQDNQAIKKLTNEQVDLYLKIYQNSDGDRPPLTPQDDWEADREAQIDREPYGQGADLDNITKLNVHSNIRPENLFRQQQLDRIKQRLTGDLIVLVIDSGKRQQVDEAVGKYNVLVQAYTNSMNLENDIRDRKDNVTIAVIDRNMLDKIPSIKKRYPHAAFILEADSPHDDGIDQYRPYLAGQIRKMADLQKLIADLYQENQRIRYNAENLRAASRFQMKKTSMVDVSNNERFSVGLSNQKAKKVFLFFKQPENSHVKTRLSDTFNTINFIPYKTVADFKRLIGGYNTYSSILIANGGDIPELEDFVSKKKEMIYVIRFNPPADLRDNPKVKKLFSTYKRDDLERFIFDEFQKYSLTMLDSLESRIKATKNVEGKRYIQKYEPNTFGTTPRFPGDFVPPKSKESTYSRKYMKSSSRSKLSSRLDALSPKSPRNIDYFNN